TGPSRSAASSRRDASACSEKRTNVLTDLLCDLGLRTVAVHDHDSLRLRLGERDVRVGDLPHEVVASALDAVVIGARAKPGLTGVERDDERPAGQEPAGDEQAQLAYGLLAQAAAGALIGDRRVEVAVAHDVRTARERGPDHGGDVLGARSGI